MPAIGAAPKNPSDPENEAGLLAERLNTRKAGCDICGPLIQINTDPLQGDFPQK
jgi:hypothetical protein